MFQVIVLWALLGMLAYSYFQWIFADIGFEWNAGNRVAVAALCVAGPAALILALVVDGMRPAEVLSNQIA